jgi:transposase
VRGPARSALCVHQGKHRSVRHSITTLFAALDVATGEVIGSIHRRHRAAEIKKFLAKLDNPLPNAFTPTYPSWLNQVERWFGLLTGKKTRRGVHRNLRTLERDIRSWIAKWDKDPEPFVWTKDVDEILQRLAAYLDRVPGAGR